MKAAQMADLGTAALAIVALFAAGAALLKPRASPAASAMRVDTVAVDSNLLARGNILGSANAKTRILEFADYQCIYCAAAAKGIDSLLNEDSSVAVVYRHYPISVLHKDAVAAAEFAECAAAIGLFRDAHSYLFAHQREIGVVSWGKIAAAIGVKDTVPMVDCMSTHRFLSRVRSDSVAAAQLGATGTPALVIGNVRLDGYPGKRVIDSVVRVSRRD